MASEHLATLIGISYCCRCPSRSVDTRYRSGELKEGMQTEGGQEAYLSRLSGEQILKVPQHLNDGQASASGKFHLQPSTSKTGFESVDLQSKTLHPPIDRISSKQGNRIRENMEGIVF
jgi:hypothetical protein